MFELREQFLKKTHKYMQEEVISKERYGHHNYVIERAVCDLRISVDKMSKEQLNRFDTELCDHLKNSDIPDSER